MGLPLGWLADRMSRRLLIALGAGFWCLATAACGLAGSFAQLFVARIGVGIGAGLALVVGGSVIGLVSQAQSIVLPVVGEVAPWQLAFIAVGLFGLVLLPLMAAVLEPVRRNEHAVAVAGLAPRIDRFIREHAGFMVRHYVAVSIYGALSWIPAHLIREFGLTPAEVGLRYGVVLLVFGGAGTIVGATLASWLARRGVAQAPIVVTTLGMACCGLVLAQAAWADSAAAALAWYGPGLLCLTLPGGTAIQEAVPNALRGQASAIYYLCNSLLGLSLGPLSVALLTDRFYGDPARVGDALALVAILIGSSTALLAYSTRRPFGRMIGQLRSGVAA